MVVLGWWVLLVLVLLTAGLVGLTAFRYGLLPTLFGGPPYVPTSDRLVEAMCDLAAFTRGDKVVDLGSGDGRLIFAAAKRDVTEAIGYEIDPWQVWRARSWAKRFGHVNARFEWRSFWDAPLNDVNVVFVYGLPPYMARVADKCAKELPSGARVVCLLCTLPGWTPVKTDDGIYLYVKV